MPKLSAARGDIAVSSFLAADDGVGGKTAVVGAGRMGSSRNWSGAVLLPRRGDRFVQVFGRWEVPRARAGNGLGPFVCSTWVGLDGFRRWMNSMPQMGTTQVKGDTGEPEPEYFAWLQWWLKDNGTQRPWVYQDVAIAPGNMVECAVTRLPPDPADPTSRDQVQFVLKVGGVAQPVQVRAPPGKEGRQIPARGASAQWILERPKALKPDPSGHIKKDDLYPLPDFGSAATDDFAATLSREPLTGLVGSTPVGKLEPGLGFRTPRLLRMAEKRTDPTRIAVIAKPARVSETVVRVTYRP